VEVFECPVCDLKYHYPSELDDHIATEHPTFEWSPKTLEDSLLGTTHRHRDRTPRYPGAYKADPPPTP